MSITSEIPRISNLSKEELRDIWYQLSEEDFNNLIRASNGKEISRIFSTFDEVNIRSFFSIADQDVIEKIFSEIPRTNIGKYLFMASRDNVKKIISALSSETLKKLLKSISDTQRNALIKGLPIKQRLRWKELIEEENELDDQFAHIISNKIDNSIEYESLQRLRQIEEQIAYKQQHHEAIVEQQQSHLEALQQQIVESEKKLHQQHTNFHKKSDELKQREANLENRLEMLQQEHEKKIQERIDIKLPEYVSDAIDGLSNKETELRNKADDWNGKGATSLKWAIALSLVALMYGAFSFFKASQANIDWLFFTYLILKGLVVIGLLGAYSKHCFNQGNAYLHEALKRSDRVHAIRFGKLYLEIYGNNVQKEDMKSIFENWNLDSNSAFTKVPSPNFEPKIIEQFKGMFDKSNKANLNTGVTGS